MKLVWIAFLLAICGCGAEPEPEPTPTVRTPATPSSAPSPAARPGFRDVTAECGLAFHHHQGKKLFYLPQVTGPGCALIDFDGDGQLDAFLVQGTGEDETQDAARMPAAGLFRQLDGRFEECGALAGADARGYGMSSAAWDFDNDGYVDLSTTYYRQPTRLYRNNGDGTFREIGVAARLHDESLIWPSSLTAFDYDRDGLLDLYQGGYASYLPADFVPDPPVKDEGHGPTPLTLLPGHYKGLPGQLYHNQGDGTFMDRTKEAGVENPGGQALDAMAADLDGDGWQDLFVANDSHSRCVVYRNTGRGRFEDVSATTNADEQRGSMGIALGDVDLDGWPDVLVSHWLNATALYRMLPDAKRHRIRFQDRALHQGLMLDRPLVGWAVGFLDADNDGYDDILQIHGHTSPPPKEPRSGKLEAQPTYLFLNKRDGYFERCEKSGRPDDPLERERVGRSAAFGDLDRDGTMDAVLNDNNSPAEVWKNRGTPNAWVGFWLVGTRSNREAVGARLTLTQGSFVRRKEVTASEGFFATNARHLLFGLADHADPVSAEVRWPSGRTEVFGDLAARRYHRLVEGSGRAR